jgi:hypothetical protein
LVFSFAGISMRRARDAGVPGSVGLFIPLLLAADGAFLHFIGEWSPQWALPRNVMLALACMTGLCALPSRRNVLDSSNPFGNPGLAAFGLGLFIAANAAITVVISNVPVEAASAVLGIYRVLMPIMTFVATVALVAMVAFVALLAWIAWRERGYAAAAPYPAQSAPHAGRAPHLPIGSFLVIALGITIGTFYVHLAARWDLALLLQPTTAVLPTLLLYFCPLAAVFLAVTRRSAAWVALLVLALLPFGLWLYTTPSSSLPLLTTSGWYRGPTRA